MGGGISGIMTCIGRMLPKLAWWCSVGVSSNAIFDGKAPCPWYEFDALVSVPSNMLSGEPDAVIATGGLAGSSNSE